MARIAIVIEPLYTRDDPGTDRIYMDVAHQFQELGVFFTEDRCIAILKEMAMSSVSFVT